MFARQPRGEEEESPGWGELAAKAWRWESRWESVSSQHGWLGSRASPGQQDQRNMRKGLEHQAREPGLSPEGAGEPRNGFEERRSMIGTGCPKCVSGSLEKEVGPEWGDGQEAWRALGTPVREIGSLSRTGAISEMKGSLGR